uniref:Uncharacterized protein n=1 Tax=Coccidioides posadasii RMSCC 3488 TaxID=454284 RepID=A0A0J6FUT8_COCPO|nr:hypothetical protein CPAG_09464 [Coccidioides posadasii RMSCC 3488]
MLLLLSSHPSPFYALRFSFTVLRVIFVLLESIPRPQGADGDWSSAGYFGSSSPILHSQGHIGTVTSFFYFSRTVLLINSTDLTGANDWRQRRNARSVTFRGILIPSLHFPGTHIVTSQLSHMGLAPSSDFLDATVTES